MTKSCSGYSPRLPTLGRALGGPLVPAEGLQLAKVAWVVLSGIRRRLFLQQALHTCRAANVSVQKRGSLGRLSAHRAAHPPRGDY